jgi:hypothetical protein
MSAGELLTRWTVRAGLACYIVVLLGYWTVDGQQRARWHGFARAVWTIGCGLLLGHLAAAFHYYHDWRHAKALAATARQTEELIGLAVGAGVYFNYLFVALWLLDVAWWWLCPAGYLARPAWLGIALQGYLFFIAFNGAVVFASGPIRWVGLALCAWLAILMFIRFHRVGVQ